MPGAADGIRGPGPPNGLELSVLTSLRPVSHQILGVGLGRSAPARCQADGGGTVSGHGLHICVKTSVTPFGPDRSGAG